MRCRGKTAFPSTGWSDGRHIERLRKLAERQEQVHRRQNDLVRRQSQITEDEMERHLEELRREQESLQRQNGRAFPARLPVHSTGNRR